MFGQSLSERGRRMEECLEVLAAGLDRGASSPTTGAPCASRRGPYTPGGPPLLYGGGTPAAARRAARFGLPFLAQVVGPRARAGVPGRVHPPRRRRRACASSPRRARRRRLFVAEDVDEGWARYGPHMLHDARMYASWLGGTAAASKSVAPTVDAAARRVRRVPRGHAGPGGRLRPRVRTAPPASALRRMPAGRRVGVAPARRLRRPPCSRLRPRGRRTRRTEPSATASRFGAVRTADA